MNAAERDPFANDVLERLTRSNVGYQREHGNYIVPLASRLLESRARVAVLEDALTEVQRLLLSGHQDSRREALDTIGAALASTGDESADQ